jgi:hypothetical protein
MLFSKVRGSRHMTLLTQDGEFPQVTLRLPGDAILRPPDDFAGELPAPVWPAYELRRAGHGLH